MKGSALAMATAASSLRRETAERLIADIIKRARTINEDGNWSYRIGRLVVFGSFLRGVDRPNDVDIACELIPRWTGQKQQEHEQARREAREGRFRNMSEWASWPKLEVFRFLRSRARGLSIQELQDWILKTTDHQVIFRDASEPAVERQR
jgi:predicted nucleotidyltransferase